MFYSALDARRAGFGAIVVEDCCRAIDLAGSRARAGSEMIAAGAGLIAANEIG